MPEILVSEVTPPVEQAARLLSAQQASRLLYGALLLALAANSVWAAGTDTFGDIVVVARNEPGGNSTHGYTEYVFVVTNRSADRTHRVELTVPRDSYSRGVGDSIRSISREIEIGPGLTENVSLWQPDRPGVFGHGLGVRIDGRLQDRAVPLNIASGSGTSSGGHYRHYGPTFAMKSATIGGPGGSGALLLISPGARKNLDTSKGGFQAVYNDDPIGRWSSRSWLGYTRYDGIVVNREEWESLFGGPAEAQAVRTALCQYTEAGGVLMILGQGPLSIPAAWKRHQTTWDGATCYAALFGDCIHTDQRDISPFGNLGSNLATSWNQTSEPFRSRRSLSDANKNLSVVDDIGVPVRGLFILMLLFAVVIGPLNIWLLTRWKRRIWLLWTVPAISLVTCVAVFAYMIVAEGWQGRAMVTAFTVLDEKEQRATTLGRTAYYSPVTPGSGLHFHLATEVTVQGMSEYDTSGAACSLDWTRDQHLRSGWVSARVPAHFQLRKCEPRRERVTFDRKAQTATNGLGVDIKTFWLMDENGGVFSAANIGAGQQVTLQPAKLAPRGGPREPGGPPPLGRPREPEVPRDQSLRPLYSNSEWANLTQMVTKNPQRVLVPGSYLAILESSPFLEQGLDGAVRRAADSAVLGLLAEEK
jgi:hypothetical protein